MLISATFNLFPLILFQILHTLQTFLILAPPLHYLFYWEVVIPSITICINLSHLNCQYLNYHKF